MSDKQPADMGGDEAQYAALAAELDGEPAENTETPPAGAADAADVSADADAGEDKSGETEQKLPYEELNKRYRQLGGALKEERERSRAFQEQLRTFNQFVEEMRAGRQQRQPEPQPKAEEKAPDPYEDPIGYVQHELAKIRGEIANTAKTATEVKEADRARTEYQQFISVVERAENEFVKTAPDYHDAAAFLEQSRRTELATLYPDSPQMDAYARQNGFRSAAHLREAIFRNDAQTVARTALQIGQNPAEAYYNLAKGRGYTPKPAGDNSPAKKAEAAIDMARRGQKAAKSLGGGGGAPDNPLSLERLSELYAEDPEEFDREWEKARKRGLLG